MVVPLMQRKLIASYRSPETKMLDDDLVDQEGYWSAYYVISYVLGWHTKLVKKEEVPKTYEALVDPKWKGGQLSFDNEAYGMLQGLMRPMGTGKSDCLFQKNRRYRAVDEKRQYRARRIGSGRRVPADDLIQPNF